MKVSYSNYGKYSSDNYGSHTLVFTDTNRNDFYFSYKTLVAFTYNNQKHVIQNLWSTTTGKHLNWIDGGNKKERLTKEAFETKYLECFGVKLEEVA
jgi:hypothetical protein